MGKIKSLPHLSLPRSTTLEKVIWSADDRITLLTSGIERGKQITRIFRLIVPASGVPSAFSQTADQGVNELAVSEDGKRILLVKADRVEVLTRSHHETGGWRWQSEGTGEFQIDAADGLERGTQIRLHLKEDAGEFTRPERLKHILEKYSTFVPHPIKLGGEHLNTQSVFETGT